MQRKTKYIIIGLVVAALVILGIILAVIFWPKKNTDDLGVKLGGGPNANKIKNLALMRGGADNLAAPAFQLNNSFILAQGNFLFVNKASDTYQVSIFKLTATGSGVISPNGTLSPWTTDKISICDVGTGTDIPIRISLRSAVAAPPAPAEPTMITINQVVSSANDGAFGMFDNTSGSEMIMSDPILLTVEQTIKVGLIANPLLEYTVAVSEQDGSNSAMIGTGPVVDGQEFAITRVKQRIVVTAKVPATVAVTKNVGAYLFINNIDVTKLNELTFTNVTSK